MSEISILFLFYVFEFIDMLAFGLTDFIVSQLFGLLTWLLRRDYYCYFGPSMGVDLAGCCSMLCLYARTLELFPWSLPCTWATESSVSVSVLVFILLHKGQILLAAKHMKTDSMRQVCTCACLTSVQEMKNVSTRSHLPMRLSWSVRHKLCQAWR